MRTPSLSDQAPLTDQRVAELIEWWMTGTSLSIELKLSTISYQDHFNRLSSSLCSYTPNSSPISTSYTPWVSHSSFRVDVRRELLFLFG